MGGHLVLAGAGHAHMTLLARMNEITAKGHRVSVVGPSERHYYSGMGPGMLGGAYLPEQISFPVKQMTTQGGGEFIKDHVEGVDPKARMLHLRSGKKIPYDVISFNTGSSIPDEVVAPGARGVFPVKPIENLMQARRLILEAAQSRKVSVGVVGGGPGALEVAGNAWAAGRQQAGKGAEVTVYGGIKFLRKTPDAVEQRARRVFSRRGIGIQEGAYVEKVETGRVHLQDGRNRVHDLVFLTTGVRPRPFFEPAGLPAGQDGGLLVNRFLQSPEFPEVFGGGDCIWFSDQPLDKVGVYAVRQNPVLFHNAWAQMEGRPLTAFDPGGEYLLIFNLGGGEGILVKWNIVFSGRAAFKIKDWIDRRFIKSFMPA